MARILNNILCTLMTFLLTFAWAVYCLKNAQAAFLLALIVALCSGYIIFALLSKLEKDKTKKKRTQKTLNDFFAFLQFNADNQQTFEPMLKFFNFEVERIDFDNAVITKENKSYCAFCFQTENLRLEQIQKAVVEAKRNDCNSLTVFCNKANGLQTLCNAEIPTKFVDLQNTYALFEQAEKLPAFVHKKVAKQHPIPQYMFNKRRFGWYFAGAIFTLTTAAFSFLKVYLLTWATVFFGLALYSLFNKKFNGTPTGVKLEQ